ncbi:MAG: methyltransferase domain-containing protein [Ectothiorhodospiraceae bacterium]|nr:methyltransferase domain-containing protein [Ectothiorhodospiraceae bacterium]MCH8503389.1 methyltransferase domain-containing protein [Ectothiorhodospiraceae bacterium]
MSTQQQTVFDPALAKQELHDEWQAAAPGWHRWVDTMESADGSGKLSRILIEAAQLRPGNAVLDVGAGYGEPGLPAARAVAPGGRVVLQDLAGDMLDVARMRVEAEELSDVEFAYLEGDAEELDLPSASFDAILSRAALMYCYDIVGTLRRLRSFLKPGGRIAACVWSTPEAVAFASPMPVILDALELPPPDSGCMGPFALAEREQLAKVVREAGFADIDSGTETAVWWFDSAADCTRFIRDVAPPITALVDQRTTEVQERVWQRVTNEAWQPFLQPDGRVRLTNEAHWVVGTNPR